MSFTFAVGGLIMEYNQCRALKDSLEGRKHSGTLRYFNFFKPRTKTQPRTFYGQAEMLRTISD